MEEVALEEETDFDMDADSSALPADEVEAFVQDVDEETSLVTSLVLHLLSEHQEQLGLGLDDELAGELHTQLHAGQVPSHPGEYSHEVADQWFRPGPALNALLRPQIDHDDETRSMSSPTLP